MSSYRVIGPKPIIPSAAMGATTITSQAFSMQSLEGCAFQPVWTGTPTGVFNILVSLDYVPSPTPGAAALNAGTWSNLGASIPTNPSGSAGNAYIPVYAACTAWIQLQYVGSSGTGVLSGSFVGKTRG